MPLDQIDIDKHDSQMSFFEHLETLRWHLFRSFVAISIGAVFCFIFKSFVFDTLIFGPKKIDFITYQWLCKLSYWLYENDRICISELKFSVQNITLPGQFLLHISVSFIAGIILAFPYILYEFWKFIKPALEKSERKKSRQFIFWCSVLFVLGILFGYLILSPVSINFLSNYSVSAEVKNIPSLKSYINFVVVLTFATGIIFELPVFILLLAKIGLISTTVLKKYRRHALVIILIFASIITPPDIASQILLTIPVYILYEVGISLASRVESTYND